MVCTDQANTDNCVVSMITAQTKPWITLSLQLLQSLISPVICYSFLLSGPPPTAERPRQRDGVQRPAAGCAVVRKWLLRSCLSHRLHQTVQVQWVDQWCKGQLHTHCGTYNRFSWGHEAAERHLVVGETWTPMFKLKAKGSPFQPIVQHCTTKKYVCRLINTDGNNRKLNKSCW